MANEAPERLGSFEYRRHPVVVPALEGEHEAKRHRVLIAGGGPVGLALALALARLGVASLVVEADETVCVGSRAICLSRRSLEILDRLGVAERFLAKGLPWTGGRSFHRDLEVLHFRMPHDADQRLPPMINIEQYYIEQYLLDGLERHRDLVEIRWGTRLEQLEPGAGGDDDGVPGARGLGGVEVLLEAQGRRYRARADWLVACDGARSRLRELLGLHMTGTSYEGRYVIADIEAELDRPTERLAWFDPPANPGRTVLMHRQPDGLWRIDYQLRPDEDADAAVQPGNVLPVIRAQLAMLGYQGPWQPIWISMYRATAVSLERYRHGRVLFAGDAAHLVPIFGVRGLNSGFEDAFNLAWKLARVTGGRAHERLLDSYSEERHYAWRQNIAQATKSTEFMAPPSRGFELMRDAVLSLAAGHPSLRSLINPRQTSSIGYPDSPLNADDGVAAPAAVPPAATSPAPSTPAMALPAAARVAGAPGEALAECPLRDGEGRPIHLTQLPGESFTGLLYCGREGLGPADAQSLAALAERTSDCALVIIDAMPGASGVEALPGASGAAVPAARRVLDADGRFAALYDARPGSFWLVRPDGHLCGRWRELDADRVLAGLERAAGRAGPAGRG